ncbi:hypothetical protein [Chitinophaga agri]|uniref:Uncharacterized protein n=1 Tax=Chitinophaga agri TaxID=2703787 RepID=A0A6B9Z7H6_9BACT|nr:hypothetical protein [Chitinophaga agri]QHS58198.1 hypothetical protein GWR21_00885 [Chitinophaga agri]
MGIGSEIFQREASEWALSNFHAMLVESKDLYQKGLSDNLIQYRAAKASGLTSTEAAWKTWTGRQALKAGYNHVNVQELKNGDVHAVFSSK